MSAADQTVIASSAFARRAGRIGLNARDGRATACELQPAPRPESVFLQNCLSLAAACLIGILSLQSPLQAQPLSPVVPPIPSAAGPADTASLPGSDPASSPEVTPALEIPPFHLTQVHLDFDVLEDRANLVATIEVMINRGEGWHRVPLRMGGAHIMRREYSGPGEESPDVTARGQDEGLVWMFKGLGRHQLKLHAWISLKPSATGGQFQLPLPKLPPQFEARVHVRIPDPLVIVRNTKSLTVLDVQRGQKSTVVEAGVVGSLLQFAWQTQSTVGESISLVQSWLHLKPGAEHLTLIVEQNFELQQSIADSLLIRLPADFRLLQVSGANLRSHEPVPDRPHWVRVHFVNDNLGRLHLRWVLERDFSETTRVLHLEGFQVEGAVREEGMIRVDEFENLRLIPRSGDSRLVHRIGVNQVRSLGAGTPVTAFEYLKQPFHLAFDVQPMVPYFLVEPQMALTFEPDAVELTVTSHVRLERGSISELKLEWPGWLQNGWRVQRVDLGGETPGPIFYDATSQPGVFRLWWPNALNHDATLSATFRRQSSEDPAEENRFLGKFQLPIPEASELAPASIVVKSADELAVSLKAPSERALMPQSADSGLPTGWQGPVQSYRMDDLSQPLSVEIQTFPRELSAVTEVAVSRVSPVQLSIEERIQLSIAHGRLRHVELEFAPELKTLIPDWALDQSVDVLVDGEKVQPQRGMTNGTLLIDLGQERIGTVPLSIQFRLPIPDQDGPIDLNIPLITLPQVSTNRIECFIDALEAMQVQSGAQGWEPLRTSPDQARWVHPDRDGTIQQIPLTIGRQIAESAQQYVVDRMLVRTIFSPDGSAECWAQCLFDSSPGRVVLQFPKHTEFRERGFALDGQVLPKSAISIRSGPTEEVTLTLPEEHAGHPRLEVRYRVQFDGPSGLTDHITLALPQFPRSVWVDQTTWEMQLPDGQHLFTSPDLLSQNHWTRHFLFWYREPSPTYLQSRSAVPAEDIPAEFRFPDHSFYAFRGFGPIREVQFRVMNRSLILLIGAGFSLLLGFLFWRIPATRNVFSLMVISFLFAVASLWYAEPILLLLQPAILGVVLALTATMLDSYSRPRTVESSTSRSSIYRPGSPPQDGSQRSVATRIYRPAVASKASRSDSSS